MLISEAMQIHSMEEIGTADTGAADLATSAGITCASNAAMKNEAAELLVARLMLERHLQKKAIDLATAITKDVMTGRSQNEIFYSGICRYEASQGLAK